MKGTLKKLSAHRVFYPLEIKAYKDDTCPDSSGYISNQLKVTRIQSIDEPCRNFINTNLT
jgi:hypothetical protein